MLGALIGDLAAWTYEHDKECFFRQLVSKDAVPSAYGRAYLNAASRNIIYDRSIDVSPIPVGPNPRPNYPKQALMWEVLRGWLDCTSLKDHPQFPGSNKLSYYAGMFVSELVKSLINGATKSEAYNSLPMFVSFSKKKDWRLPASVYYNEPLSYVLRAWNAFYLGFDFTSCIHNAMKWPGDKHLMGALTGAFASAMYGCRYNYIKKKFAVNGEISHDLIDFHYGERFGYHHGLILEMANQSEKLRHFFPKNNALTNVEQHQWIALEVSNIRFNEDQVRQIKIAGYTSWDNRFGLYLDNGKFYVYRSNVVVGRFEINKGSDNIYSIISLQASGEMPSGELFEALYYALSETCNVYSKELADISICLSKLLYYKGEKECPEEWKADDRGKFWFQEQVLFGTDINEWIMRSFGVRRKLSREYYDRTYTWTDEQLAIWSFIYTNWGSWCPYDELEWTLNYIPEEPFDKKSQRNNTQNQALADECAKQHKYYCANFIGTSGDYLVYSPTYRDSIPRCEGLPMLVLVKNGIARFVGGELSFSYLDNMKFRDYRKGREILKNYIIKFETRNYASKKEENDIRDIVNLAIGSRYDIPFDKNTIYEYLELANRLGMRLKVRQTKESSFRLDGWEYYLELVKK